MKVMKFGGTSVGSAQRIKNVASLVVEDGQPKVIVLSAMSGTTNSLLEIAGYYKLQNSIGAADVINRLEQKYAETIDELYSQAEYKQKASEVIRGIFDYIRSFANHPFTIFEERCIVAQGELMSTNLMNLYLQQQGVKVAFLPALEYMRIDKNAEPDFKYIEEHLKEQMAAFPDQLIYVTQGFICRNAYGEIDNLQRGGSDYSASIVGAAIRADEIQIWTDIDGMHNNDPRFVEGTKPVRNLNFDEAAELAYFGAKILHPTCITPARMYNIPVRLLNTMEPSAPGTMISNQTEAGKIKAIAAKDGITSIRIKSSRMLLAYGFMSQVFEVFDRYKTSVDLVTTSEVGVSLTIDNDKKLDEIVTELKKFGTVQVDKDMVIIAVVGDMKWDNLGFESRVVEAMADVPIRMISYGGSNYNISMLVKKDDKIKALQSLSAHLF
ncbi:MAG: aspartate kinase [Bacteroidales bacterium]|jgi:aspartate kinase|nr:aspartate kinase [Bacteroidales bacterium]MCR5362533.1 aspartate kinase [Bacteroidales bacterium]